MGGGGNEILGDGLGEVAGLGDGRYVAEGVSHIPDDEIDSFTYLPIFE